MLDAGPLGMVTHPRAELRNRELLEWIEKLLSAEVSVLVPEIADYEVRRELLRAGRRQGVERLDNLEDAIGYEPLTTEIMQTAARLWAEARNEGRPTAPDEALDADVILAAQALALGGGTSGVVIATTNVGHLARFTEAKLWQEIEAG